MRDTSLLAYFELQPKLGQRQATILSAIRSHPNSTDLELSQITGLPINCVTPRRGELEAMGLIVAVGKKRQVNGKVAYMWRAT